MKVFILGAGASYAATAKRFPLTRGFFGETLPDGGLLGQFLSRDFVGMYPAPPEKFNISPTAMKAWEAKKLLNLSVEEVFVYLEDLIENSVEDDLLSLQYRMVRTELLTFISQRLSDPDGISASRKPFRRFLAKLQQRAGDSVITFNWDILLDQCFSENGESYFRYLRNPGIHPPPIPNNPALAFPLKIGQSYLKLHGSLNWYICLGADCPVSNVIRREGEAYDPDSDTLLSISDRPVCLHCGRSLSRALIPPVIGKAHRRAAGIRSQWRIASELLRKADTWVFIGYSLPMLDVESQALFRSAVRNYPSLLTNRERNYFGKGIHIADPSADDIAKRLKSLIPMYFEVTKYSGLDEFLERFPDAPNS